MEEVVISIEETQRLAGRIIRLLKPGDVLALYGNLGTGKTTFTSFLVKALGINSKVQSPSFILARVYERDLNTKERSSPTPEEYKGLEQNINKVNHLDLYRLQDQNEVKNLGLEEYFNQPNSITIIEWPEIAEDFLPSNTKRIEFEDLGENKRKIYFK